MITITEALAELKTITKRIEKKRAYIINYLGRQDGLKDPLEKDGGSIEVIRRERQAIKDLENRMILIRTRIQQSNLYNRLTVLDEDKSVAEWLTWRKEVSSGAKSFIDKIRLEILTARKQAAQRGNAVVTPGAVPVQASDVLINVDEAELARESEKLEEILGTLDGKLSLTCATSLIDV